jgi:hypothetical protein
MEIVGMRCSETRNGLACLRPGGGIFGMREGHHAALKKSVVENAMGRQVGRWTALVGTIFPFKLTTGTCAGFGRS